MREIKTIGMKTTHRSTRAMSENKTIANNKLLIGFFSSSWLRIKRIYCHLPPFSICMTSEIKRKTNKWATTRIGPKQTKERTVMQRMHWSHQSIDRRENYGKNTVTHTTDTDMQLVGGITNLWRTECEKSSNNNRQTIKTKTIIHCSICLHTNHNLSPFAWACAVCECHSIIHIQFVVRAPLISELRVCFVRRCRRRRLVCV